MVAATRACYYTKSRRLAMRPEGREYFVPVIPVFAIISVIVTVTFFLDELAKPNLTRKEDGKLVVRNFSQAVAEKIRAKVEIIWGLANDEARQLDTQVALTKLVEHGLALSPHGWLDEDIKPVQKMTGKTGLDVNDIIESERRRMYGESTDVRKTDAYRAAPFQSRG